METVQPLGLKIKRIRKSLGYSRDEFSKLVNVPFSTLKNYELLYRNVSSSLVLTICNHPVMHKYTLWLVSDTTCPEIGQVEPPPLKGSEEASEESDSN